MPGSIPGVCSNLGVSGAAQRLFPRGKYTSPKINRGTLDFHVFNDFFMFGCDFGVCRYYFKLGTKNLLTPPLPTA